MSSLSSPSLIHRANWQALTLHNVAYPSLSQRDCYAPMSDGCNVHTLSHEHHLRERIDQQRAGLSCRWRSPRRAAFNIDG